MSEKASLRQNFYNGLAKCSRRKLCYVFFTQIEPITLIWVSLERSPPLAERDVNFVQRCYVRSGTKANIHHWQLWVARKLVYIYAWYHYSCICILHN